MLHRIKRLLSYTKNILYYNIAIATTSVSFFGNSYVFEQIWSYWQSRMAFSSKGDKKKQNCEPKKKLFKINLNED